MVIASNSTFMRSSNGGSVGSVAVVGGLENVAKGDVDVRDGEEVAVLSGLKLLGRRERKATKDLTSADESRASRRMIV